MLQIMLGGASVRLITLLDPNSATPARLRELLLGLRTREGLLASKDSRTLLFDLLRPNEAEMLALALGIRTQGNIYDALKATNIRSGSESERSLFNFFELYVPEAETRIEYASTEQSVAQYPLFSHQRRAA